MAGHFTASCLYAKSQGVSCSGDWNCHWCDANCNNQFVHDEPYTLLYVKTKSLAKQPASAYICLGCWLFRRQRMTINYMDKSWKDSQSPQTHSWVITDTSAVVPSNKCKEEVYKFLMNPPKRFVLSLLNKEKVNLLHVALLNDNNDLEAGTELKFTIDNTPYQYTVYEFEKGLREGTTGKEPGVRALIDLFGKIDLPPIPNAPDKGRAKEGDHGGRYLKKKLGRPKKEEETIPSSETHIDNHESSNPELNTSTQT